MELTQNSKTWKWRPKRWWVSLILFWLASTTGAEIIARNTNLRGAENGFIIMIMLIFAIFSAFTDRSWSMPIRIAWVFGIWIIHAFLTIPSMYIIGVLAYPTQRPELFYRAVSLIAAIPLVIWAMRRSKFFVESISKEDK